MGTGLGTGAVLGCRFSVLGTQYSVLRLGSFFIPTMRFQRRGGICCLLVEGDEQIPRRFAPGNDKCFGRLGKSKGKTKRARHIFRGARASRRLQDSGCVKPGPVRNIRREPSERGL
jgi:hypothetical protein